MLQEVKENWQERERDYWHLDRDWWVTTGRNIAVKTQKSDGYLDPMNSYLQTQYLLLDASRSRNKQNLRLQRSSQFQDSSLSCSYRLSLDLWPSQRFCEQWNSLPNFSSLQLFRVCLGCLKPRILTSARWISFWPDIKSVDLTPKANILSNDKAPETYPLMAAIRQSNLYDQLPQEPLDFFRERVVGNNFHFTETLWTSSMGKVSWVAVGCLNQVKERFRPN